MRFATVSSLICVVGVTCASRAVGTLDIGPHDKFLRENFDTSEAKGIWADENWWVGCFFVDLNQDGFVDVISSTVSQSDRSGDAWSFWTAKPDGKLHEIRKGRLFSMRFRFNCFHYSYYWLDCGDGLRKVIGLDMRAGITEADRVTWRFYTPDCVFGIEGDQLVVKGIVPSLDKVFYDNKSAQIGRLFSEGYGGFDFKYEPSDDWYGYKHPKPVAMPKAPAGFDAFVSGYRKEAQIRAGTTNAVPVFTVFLDADNDGLSDFYITSDADCEEHDAYRWTLYVNDNGSFKRATGPVRPVKGRDDLPRLPPEVVARKDAFCRVIRFDAPPTHIILNDATVAECLVKRTITYRFTHSIAKLPCKEY